MLLPTCFLPFMAADGEAMTIKPPAALLLAHPMAHKDGPALICAILLRDGSMCPVCGFGTRATSKKWARCKRCGERVERNYSAPPGHSGSTVQPAK